jgi:DNA-binding protein HU-beta
MAKVKMTKSQLVATLSEKTGFSKKDVNGLFEELATVAYKEVKKAGEFTLPGFGKMVKAKRKARTGVNPATGEKIKIAAKTVVKFRLAKAAKDAVL